MKRKKQCKVDVKEFKGLKKTEYSSKDIVVSEIEPIQLIGEILNTLRANIKGEVLLFDNVMAYNTFNKQLKDWNKKYKTLQSIRKNIDKYIKEYIEDHRV